MENEICAEKLNEFEREINTIIDLLSVAKGYCDLNYDKSSELVAISTVIEILLNKQLKLASDFDSLITSNL